VLAQPIGPAATPVAGAPGLSAMAFDPSARRTTFLDRWGDVIRAILDRGTYLDDADIAALVDTALPGGDEIFAALALAELIQSLGADTRLVIDTAPTGHTLRLLDLPRTFRALVRLLDAMQGKHRFMVRALMRTYKADSADTFLAEMNELVSVLERSLTDATRCGAILVTNGDTLVRAESRRYLGELAERRVHVIAVIWNGEDGVTEPLDDVPAFAVPRLAEFPVGVAGLTRWADALAPAKPRGSAPSRRPVRSSQRPSGDPPTSRLLRPLTIVAGKGGVGKTTVAAALALEAAQRHRTLLVSTDPAPSLADVYAQEIPDADTPVAGVATLLARQMDATAAFARLRGEYRDRVDALFEGLVGKGVDLAHDRAIVRDLLALAPPGIDEIYALTLLSEALGGGAYARVVVDPAPTGHLLRLLEMPQLALDWSHQLMRLMLKYKDITGLGETARELLDLSRNLRVLDGLLRDAARAGVVVVTLREPVVLQETARLAAEIDLRGVAVTGTVLNRSDTSAALPAGLPAVHFQAPVAEPPPVGVDALRRWRASWIAP
jgi:arsenite-transporting ATPase